MNIRSLLLGSVAVAGLTTAGYAADLGVVTSLDVCDELGLSGLTISSDDTCLIIWRRSVEVHMGRLDDVELAARPMTSKPTPPLAWTSKPCRRPISGPPLPSSA